MSDLASTTASYLTPDNSELVAYGTTKYTGTSANGCATAPSGATSFTFDGRGNQLTAGATSYSYDSLDRATSLAGTTASYLTPDNSELVAYGTTSFQNNLLGLSRQFAPSSTTNYVRDPTGTPVSQRTSASKQFFLNDTLGSTIALTDTSGSIVRSYTYDPDGNATSTGSGATTDLKYVGGHQLAGLTHFAARYHDPGTARWTQADPMSNFTGLTEANRFAYAGDDPINSTDPSGACPFCVVVAGAVARVAVTAVARRVAGTAAGRLIGSAGARAAGTRVGSRVFGYGRGLNTGRIRMGLSRDQGIDKFSIRVDNNHFDLFP